MLVRDEKRAGERRVVAKRPVDCARRVRPYSREHVCRRLLQMHRWSLRWRRARGDDCRGYDDEGESRPCELSPEQTNEREGRRSRDCVPRIAGEAGEQPAEVSEISGCYEWQRGSWPAAHAIALAHSPRNHSLSRAIKPS